MLNHQWNNQSNAQKVKNVRHAIVQITSGWKSKLVRLNADSRQQDTLDSLGLFGFDYNPRFGGETQEAKKITPNASLLRGFSSTQLLYSGVFELKSENHKMQ
jgi:hypothetical protein